MEDRGFSEVELRAMLHDAVGYRLDVIDGRWIIDARLRGRSWEVVVEPDDVEQLLVAVTAYPLE
jgi:hypothetical protein